MQYYHDIDGREAYIGQHGETKPTATNFADGMKYLDVDDGIWYVVSNGAWIVDESEYNSTIIESDGDFVNVADVITSVHDTNRIITGNVQERELRRGNMYVSGYVWSSVASNAIVNLHIVTGALPIYFTYSTSGTALADYGLYEGVTVSNNGTALTTSNRNKVNTVAPTTTTFRDATYTNGTVMIPRFLGTGGNVQTRSGGIIIEQTDILLANSHYIVSLKNSATATQDRMSIVVDWYEVDWL